MNRVRLMQIIVAVILVVMLLAPPNVHAGCRVMDYYECDWFDNNCDPCTASARTYLCDDGWKIVVVGCCWCT